MAEKLSAEEREFIKLPKKSADGDLPETIDEWKRHIRGCYETGLDHRRKYELQWTVNFAYYQGYQNLLFDQKTGILRISNDIKVPLIVNRIGAFVDARHAKLTKHRPTSRVIPNTTEPEDRYAAKYSDQSLQHLWRKIGMDTQNDRLFKKMLIFGTNLMKTVWDPHAGDIITRISEKDGVVNLEDDGSLANTKVFEGEVSSRELSPFSFIPGNDLCPEMRDQPYVIELINQTQTEWEEMYPHLRGKLKKADEDSTFTPHEKMVNRLGGGIFSSSSRSDKDSSSSLNNSIRGMAFWMRPNYQFEKGVVAILVQGHLAMIDVWPNDYGLNVYPHVRFVEHDDGIHFWGQATMERLIPVQREYNKMRQHVGRNAQLMAKGKWMVPKGSHILQDALDDDSGEIVEYNPTVTEPHQAVIAPLPSYVIEHTNMLLTDFRDTGGQRETSTSPGTNLTAAVAMQMQAEQTDEIIGPIIRRTGEAQELVANTQLELINQEWIEVRKIKVIGAHNAFGVQWISKMDLKNHTDVHIEIESMYPDFRGAKRQTLIDLWDRRVIQDPKVLLRAFRFGNFDVLMEEQEESEERVSYDISELKKGKQPEVTPFQNHMEYVRMLTKFVQTPEFLRLIPQRKQMMIQNIQMHLKFLMGGLPGQGAPVMQQNQNSVNTPTGSAVPVGTQGNGASPGQRV